jgi:molecular chaperone IbpA
MVTRISLSPLCFRSVGFDTLIREVESMLNDDAKPSTFPPHNIIKDENRYVVELAIAGFKRNEVDISVEDGVLTIKGEQKETPPIGEYLHRGIGTRSFTKTIKISDTVVVRGAEFTDGILRIGLENVIPEHKKPRKVEIGSVPLFTQPTEKQLLVG